MAEAQAVGDATAFAPSEAGAALSKFVAKTGDLETGRGILLEMAKAARVTGASLDDMVDAAGDVKSALGDAGTAKEIGVVMRTIAGNPRLPLPILRRPVKAFMHLRQIIRRNAVSIVLHGTADHLIVLRNGNDYAATGWCIFHAVFT